MQPEAKGFFESLFDFSFSSLIATRIIKILYVLGLVVIGFGYLAFSLSAFAADPAAGILVLLIVGPIVALLYIVYTRVLLEGSTRNIPGPAASRPSAPSSSASSPAC